MSKPLAGKRIVVTRSPDQAEAMCRQLEALGATAIAFPAIDFVPLPAPELDDLLEKLADFDWIVFTSGNAVRYFWERLSPSALSILSNSEVLIAAVGSATHKLLAEKGMGVDFMPEEFTGEKLATGLGDLRGRKILLPRARIGRPEIVALLREQGAEVTEVGLYDTITAKPTPEALRELAEGVDVITFTSPSSVRNFLKIGVPSGILAGAIAACIGPSTAAEAEANGLVVAVQPEAYTIEALVSSIAEYFGSQLSGR